MIRADTLHTIEQSLHGSKLVPTGGMSANRNVNSSVGAFEMPVNINFTVISSDFSIKKNYGVILFIFNSKL